MSILSKLGKVAIPVGFAGLDYKAARDRGDSTPAAVVSAAGEFAMGEVFGLGYMGILAAQAAPGMISGAVSGMAQQQRRMSQHGNSTPFQGATFLDTKQAYTMRQAAMGEMSKNKRIRSQMMMGQEARFMGR